MRRTLQLTIVFFFLTSAIFAQSRLTGFVYDENTKPIPFATVALLDLKDSTLLNFGVSDNSGKFEIKDVSLSSYLLQVSYLGYNTFYKQIEVKQNEEQIPLIVLKPKSTTLNEVKIEADRIPIAFKKDTVEYDAAAYKTKPDAVAEDLLKKLPGVEVDRAGNIKAMGENVSNVLVDGKEFFSNDPKVATKNLPVDAIKKVQVYDRKSDEEELSGMSDGERDKTINILLKDNKKKAYFGDVQAGMGTNNRYQSNAKLYKFDSKNQIAALGMINNINQFGFSFQDYMSFSGGLNSLNDGTMNLNSNAPINFGQTINGLLQSGALGLNFTREYAKAKRFNISYMATGIDKNLKEDVFSRNFIENDEFKKLSDNNNLSREYTHKLNLVWRNKIDTVQNLNVYSNINFGNATSDLYNLSYNLRNDQNINSLIAENNSTNIDYSGNIRANYSRKMYGNWRILKFGYESNISESNNMREWRNTTTINQTGFTFIENRSQSQRNNQIKNTLSSSSSWRIYNNFYLDASIQANVITEKLNREQKNIFNTDELIDSLSPNFDKKYQYVKPGLFLNYNTDKTQINIGADIESMELSNGLLNNSVKFNQTYILPEFEFQNEYARGKRLRALYTTRINTPNINQLLPTVNNANPTLLSYGNQNLKPEYINQYSLSWFIFDQFSFISFVNNLNFTHTQNKVSWNRNIDSNLVQELKTINVDNDYRLRFNSEFSSPIRKLKINVHLDIAQNINKSYTIINGIENENINVSNEFTLRIDNRKKDKWDINVGGTISINNSTYSLQSELNNQYTNSVYFSELSYKPNDKWFMQLTADISHYSSQSFDESLSIPLLRFEINRYLLKNNRGVFSVNIFDILNKNTDIQRVAEQNILQETRSNIIGRYIIFGFKYRLSQFASKEPGIKIDIK